MYRLCRAREIVQFDSEEWMQSFRYLRNQ